MRSHWQFLTTNCLINWTLPTAAHCPRDQLRVHTNLHPMLPHTERSRPLYSVWIDVRLLGLATVLTTEVPAIRCAACFPENQALYAYVP